MHTLIDVFHSFSHDCNAHESRGATAIDNGARRSWTTACICASTSDNPPSQLIPAAPKQPFQMPYRHVTDVFALSQVHQELSVLSTLPRLLSSLEVKLHYWFHLHLCQLQSTYSRVHRSNFCSSFRLFRLACDNGCIFKVFWKKLAGGHGHVKRGTVFCKNFLSVYSDRWEGCPLWKALF